MTNDSKIQLILAVMENREQIFRDECVDALKNAEGNENDPTYQFYLGKLEEVNYLKHYFNILFNEVK